MKVTLEFDWYEEREELDMVMKATKTAAANDEFLRFIRGIVKHGTEEAQHTTWEQVREKFFEFHNDDD